MLIVALALLLAGPLDMTETPAALPTPAATSGYVLLGGFKDDDNLQFGFADMSTYVRTGDKVDVWENWLPYRAIPSPKGPVALYRRRFTYDCSARNDTMTEVKAFDAKGKLLQSFAIPNPRPDSAEPGMIGYSTVAFMCDGADPAWGLIVFPTWDEAVADARRMAEKEFGAK